MRGIDRLAPTTRLVLTLAFAVAAMTLGRPLALVVVLGIVIAAALATGVSLRVLLRRLWALEGFLAVMLLLLPFTIPGTPAFTFLGWTGSEEGMHQAVAVALRAHVVALAALTLLGGLETVELGRAMARLGMPESLVRLFLFTLRYISVLEQEYSRLSQAMRARAFVPRATRHTWRSTGHLFGMLLVRSLERAERIEAAMRCRGFSGRFPSLGPDRDRHPGALDWAVGSAASALLVLAVGLGA